MRWLSQCMNAPDDGPCAGGCELAAGQAFLYSLMLLQDFLVRPSS
ncbi:MAG: hypothetical protein K0S45_1752 [Nitrospira sp.]|nr:hypothetical protein [Nitrospira sp.]